MNPAVLPDPALRCKLSSSAAWSLQSRGASLTSSFGTSIELERRLPVGSNAGTAAAGTMGERGEDAALPPDSLSLCGQQAVPLHM
jgi:hypothetical protein